MTDDEQKEPVSSGRGILSKRDPLNSARKLITDIYRHADHQRLLHAMDLMYEWDVGPAWSELPAPALRKLVYEYLDRHDRIIVRKDQSEEIVPFQPTKGDVDQVIDALKAITYVNAVAPCWIGEADELPDTRRIVVAKNGIIDLNQPSPRMFTPTPALFTTNFVPFDYQPDAAPPLEWMAFMESIWPDDIDSRQALQEFMGLSLIAETCFQKGLLIVGPMRAGKGTIARVWAALIGIHNVAGPTLSSFSTNFGLWPLIGKLLAIIDDARLSGRTDQAMIVERLLSITGEGFLTCDRKNLSPITLKLMARLVLMTNEMPKLADASGALANRWIVLRLTESFIGREDHGLTNRLLAELPGILNWAIEGWRRLQARGRFIQPAAGQDAIDEMMDLASPVGAFVREWCTIGAAKQVVTHELFEAWQAWCAKQGRHDGGTIHVFGRDLRAAVPGVDTKQPRIKLADDEEASGRIRCYSGIDLTLAAREASRIHHAASQNHGRKWGAP